MSIKQIFDEIAAESSTNKKVEILSKYKDNGLLKEVLYKACSKRVKFYIKTIPEYKAEPMYRTLNLALDQLTVLSNREKTGYEAIAHLADILSHLSPDDAYIIERVISKDPKVGFRTKMLNKVWPDLIEKVGYQGCKPYSKDLVEKLFKKHKKVFSQLKLDGQYVNIIIDDSASILESRQGEPTNLEAPRFLEELKKLPNGVLNAELTMDGVERYKSNGMITSLISIANKKSNGENVDKEIAKFESKHIPYRDALDLIRVTAWDFLTLEEYYSRTCARIYDDRLEELNKVLFGFEMLSVV